uniref:UBX domain-containing protein n=2 Tax=Lotharella globosa TaxID=91324 RepID=A0A7S3YI01_9EUKA
MMFPAKSYDLLAKNCNHFSELFCLKLGVTFPNWVNRMAKMGAMMQGKGDFVAQEKAKIQQAEARRREKEAKMKELKTRQGQLKPEADANAKGVILIQVNCPGGKKARRRFVETDTIGDVMEFVYAYDSMVARKGFELVQTMPRKVFSNNRMTLAAAGLKGRANLFVKKKM